MNVVFLKFDPTEETLTVLGFVIGILNAILPMAKINDLIFPKREEVLTNERYSVVKYTFSEVLTVPLS